MNMFGSCWFLSYRLTSLALVSQLLVWNSFANGHGDTLLLRSGDSDGGAVLVKGAKNFSETYGEYSFLPAYGFTMPNTKVACAELGFQHALYPISVKIKTSTPVHEFTLYCSGGEGALQECEKVPSADHFQTMVAGVMCSDNLDEFTLGDFPLRNVSSPEVRMASDEENPEWYTVCVRFEKDSSSFALATCRQAGYLQAIERGLPLGFNRGAFPSADALYVVEQTPCFAYGQIEACDVSLHVVRDTNCYKDGFSSFVCSQPAFTLLGYGVDVCSEDLCQASRGDISNPQRRTCFCDQRCEIYHDCCFDYVTFCRYGFESEAVTSLFYSDRWIITCAENMGEMTDSPYSGLDLDSWECLHVDVITYSIVKPPSTKQQFFLFVSKCPREWNTDDTVKFQCESNWNATSPINHRIPHIDTRFNIHFKNIYCGLCNGVDGADLRAWQGGSAFHPDEEPLLFAEPGADFPPRTCTPAVSICQESYRGTPLEEACEAYVSIVIKDGISYRNDHCAVCNGKLGPPDTDCRPADYSNGTIQGVNSNAFVTYSAVRDRYITAVCIQGTHLESGRCVPDYSISLEVQSWHCSSTDTRLVLTWSAEVLHTGQRPVDCFAKALIAAGVGDGKATWTAISPLWTYTYSTDHAQSRYLVSIEGATSWDERMLNIDKLTESLHALYNDSLLPCQLLSMKIELDCFLGKQPIHIPGERAKCPGTLLSENIMGDIQITTIDNEPFAYDNGNLLSVRSVTETSTFGRTDQLDDFTDDTIVCCVAAKQTKILNCETVLLPNSSYEPVDNNDTTSLMSNTFLLPSQDHEEYVMLPNGSRIVCKVSDFFMLTDAQKITSRVLFSLHSVSLLLTFVTYCVFPSLRTLPGLCVMTVVMSLLVVNILMEYVNDFVRGIPWLCKTMGVLAHYTWLTAMGWMTILAWNIVCTFVFQKSRKRSDNKWRKYGRIALVGFGAPAFIVFPCVIIDLCDCTGLQLSYGASQIGQETCWIYDAWTSLVVFGAPLFVCLSLNAIFFSLTVAAVRKAKREASMATQENTNTSPLAQTFADMLVYLKISSVMGFTWIVGYVAAFSGVRSLWYVFIVLNSLQGVLIFISFACSATVRKLWQSVLGRMRKKTATSPSAANTATSGATKDTHV